MVNDKSKYVLFGASSTLGQAITKKLASNDCLVCGILHNNTPSIIADNCTYLRCDDASDSTSVSLCCEKIATNWGYADHIVNCIGKSQYHDYINDDIESWYNEFNANFKSAVNVSHFGANLLIKSQNNNKSIVMIGSGYGERHIPYLSPYCISKGAISVLVKVLSTELALRGIRINMITPGLFPSNMTNSFIDNSNYINQLMEHIPDKSLGSADDIANIVILLTSNSFKHVNGADLIVDGGMLNLLEGGIKR